MSTSQHEFTAKEGAETASVSRKLKPGEDPQTLARDGYNNAAQSYLDWTSSLPDFRIQWLHKLLEHLQHINTTRLSDSRCLELGCGAGVPATLKLAQTCAHVTGVEISSVQIELAKSTFRDAGISDSKFEFVESDMTAASFHDDSFDIVCAFYSIIHLSLEDQRNVLGRIYRWMTPGGLFLFNVATTPTSEDGNVNENWLGMTAYWASFGEEKTLKILREMGYVVMEHQVQESKGDAAFTWIIVMRPLMDNAESQ